MDIGRRFVVRRSRQRMLPPNPYRTVSAATRPIHNIPAFSESSLTRQYPIPVQARNVQFHQTQQMQIFYFCFKPLWPFVPCKPETLRGISSIMDLIQTMCGECHVIDDKSVWSSRHAHSSSTEKHCAAYSNMICLPLRRSPIVELLRLCISGEKMQKAIRTAGTRPASKSLTHAIICDMLYNLASVLIFFNLLAVGYSFEYDRHEISIPLSRRNDPSPNSGIADLTAIKARRDRLALKYDRGFNAYKNSIGTDHPLRSVVSQNAVKRTTGSDPLTQDGNGVLYQGTISVGSPPQNFTVDFDTGSSDLYLPGPTCTENCEGHKTYYYNASSTAVDLQKNFTLTFGDKSSVTGAQYNDTVSIANFTAANQTLGAATTLSSGDNVELFPPDGLAGMAYQPISVYNATPLFQNIYSQGQLTAPVFSFRLAPTEDGGELYLGGVNNSQFTGNITFTPVTTQGYWQVDLESILVNNQTVLSQQAAVIDTGTTQIVGPVAGVQEFYKGINGSLDIGSGIYTVPCDSIPTISFSFNGTNGTTFSLNSTLFNQGPVNATSRDCVGGIVALDLQQNLWILGDLFLRNVYSVFDFGYNRVGFATLSGNMTNATTSL